MFFLTFISSFYLIVYLVRFNTNNRHHFLPFYVNACVQLHNLHLKLVYDNKQQTTMFAEKDGATINNEGRK